MNKKFEIRFEIFPLDLPTGWASAVHLTFNSNAAAHGDRIPAIFLNKDSYWAICSSVGSSHNHCHMFHNVSLHSWTSFSIWQDQIPDGNYMYEYSVNNDTMYSILNTEPRNFENVKVYGSDPW